MYTGTYLVLGGAGLVGLQVCRNIAREFGPKKIVVASLRPHESEEAVSILSREFPDTEFAAAWGNLFVPHNLANASSEDLLGSGENRRALRNALYGNFKDAYNSNHLVQMILEHRPEVLIDSVNTATGISYQNVFDGAAKLIEDMEAGNLAGEMGQQDLEVFLLSQSVPQIIRHVRFLYEATKSVGTHLYLKIGTTGTGGMGLNIPYTHSEDKPSKTLLAKTEVAFGHTGLLFLMARTPDAPIVKEIKPAAMIGYKAVEYVPIKKRGGAPVHLYTPASLDLSALTDLTQNEEETNYTATGDLHTTVVNTGENGIFTLGEFATITAMGQMEFVTPEEIATNVVLEIKGVNPGVDILGAVDSTVMGPSYRAGLLRRVALNDLQALEEEKSDHSVALGQLGPPELSKLLYEAYLLRAAFPDTSFFSDPDSADEAGNLIGPDTLSKRVSAVARDSAVVQTAVSVGIPVLMPDGHELLRGPHINIPELRGHALSASITDENIDQWARKGWIDLRAPNMALWIDRFRRMRQTRQHVYAQGSAAVDRRTYLGESLEIGEVVAWIFNNEMGGYRLK
jgi:hypothetical protein